MSSTPSFDGDPQTVYSQWAQYLDEHASSERRRERQLSHMRLVVFVLGLAAGWLAFGSHQIPASWTLPPVALFLILVLLHDRVIRRLRVIDRSIEFFARGLARLDGTWPGQGRPGSSHLETGHPYANDLDILGEGSLFELLGTVRTSAGDNLLAHWLLNPASAEVARQRQAAVRELIPRVELRRDLALLGETIANRVASERLIEWGNAPASLRFAGLQWVAPALTALTLGSLAVWIWSGAGAVPFIVAVAIQSAFALALRPWVTATLASAEAPSHDLTVLSGLLARLEKEPVEAGRLVELSEMLEGQSMPPSRRIRELGRLMQFVDARRNQFFAPIGALLLWGTQMAFALERWRADCGSTLSPWIDASAEIEVLCALSGYAYEHPNDIFPELIEEGPIFEAEALGHPLIPDSECVRNDLALSSHCRALVMSGSNMSGKSTLLRTVGCAVVLALAGAPVRAERLRLSPLRIGASIRISDSLREGTSHFLAEIKRLRQIVDLTEGTMPALFLLDEILHGTNSHDRRIGADAVLRGLLERGAIGIVTTHDLALARIADHEELAVENVHFQDQMENGRMFFDFRLRGGVVARSNAIELMRSVGLDI